MTIGEKIKSLRVKMGLTQSKLCASTITRNMLSEIECDKATPSIATLKYIASQLNVSPAYLISDDEDLLFFEKKNVIEKAINYYREKRYKDCIEVIGEISSRDDEMNYLLAECHFALGKSAVLSGALITAKEHLSRAQKYSSKTAYNTAEIENLILMYSALAENIQSPLLEFDIKKFEEGLDPNFEFELYRYIISDYEYKYKNPVLKKHVEAKIRIKNRQYREALVLLDEIINEKNPSTYNSYVMFGVYTDMEYCSKQLANFEAAYKYASKRLSMLEGFKA